MARIRTIKPEFFTSLTIAGLDLAPRLTFIGLWTHVDDEGRCVDEPRLIKAALWPLDDRTTADIEDDLRALHKARLIIRYEVDGRRYIAVRNWKEHQRINRPTPSKLPPPPSDGGGPYGGLTEDSVSAHGGLSESSVSPHSDVGGWLSEPSPPPGMSDSAGGAAAAPAKAATSDNEVAEPAPSCRDALTESSVSPHGALTEDSLQERKGREQGTGKGREVARVRAREGGPPSLAEARLAPLAPPHDPAPVVDRNALAAELADELSVRTGLEVTPAHCAHALDELLEGMPPQDIPGLWIRRRVREAADVRRFLTPSMAAAVGRSQGRGRVPARRGEPAPVPLPDDFAPTDAMRRWAAHECPGVDVDFETAQFVSHHRACGTTRVSWPDEWQKWMRRAHRTAHPTAAPASAPAVDRRQAATDAMFARALARARARDALDQEGAHGDQGRDGAVVPLRPGLLPPAVHG